MKGGDRTSMNTAISLIISSLATIVSGIVLFYLKKMISNHHKTEEERDASKAEETLLILRSLDALGKLTVANSIALRDGKSNGELSSALGEYEKVQAEMYRYLLSSHTKHTH